MALLARKSTPARIAASRANGAKSRGPITARGKSQSRRNGLRHGLRAQFLNPLAEDPTARDYFRTLLTSLLEEIDPTDPRQFHSAHRFARAMAEHARIDAVGDQTLRNEILRLRPAHRRRRHPSFSRRQYTPVGKTRNERANPKTR